MPLPVAATAPADRTPLRASTALHVGASSVSLLVADVDAVGLVHPIDFLLQPCPLARDIFRRGEISRATTERVVDIIRGFQHALAELGLDPLALTRCAATNILTESGNHDAFLNRLRVACGLEIQPLDDGEMTRLIYLKTRRRLHDTPAMRKKTTLVVHVGPGNTRALLFEKGAISRYTSYRLGTHRTREAVEASSAEGPALLRVIREHASGNLAQLRHDYSDVNVEEIVAIGSELQLVARFASAPGQPLTTKALRKLATHAAGMSDLELVRKFQLDYQTADALLPALETNLAIVESLRLPHVFVPASDYEQGLLQDLLVSRRLSDALEQEVLRSARILANRYQSDPRHGEHVAGLCSQIFDNTADLHHLGPHDALLLKVAAILHEVGSFISPRAHHKHSEYIILNSEIFGLDRHDVTIIALVARYHRHASPSPGHPSYHDLAPADRIRVSMLAGILRVADALERTHDQRVGTVSLVREPGRLRLRLHGVADAAIERLAMQSKGDVFEQVFGLGIVLEEAP